LFKRLFCGNINDDNYYEDKQRGKESMNDGINNDSGKKLFMYQLKWISTYIAVGIIISLILPFPISIITALIICLLISFYKSRRMTMKRTCMYRKKGLLDSSIFGVVEVVGGQHQQLSTIKYYCMSCGKLHKETSCPVCGSKMRRIDS
jgi:hypothetical protein